MRPEYVEILARLDQSRWEQAQAVVVTLDADDDDAVLNVVGPFESPLDAMMAAAAMDKEDARLFAQDEEFGHWKHVVVPMFKADR